MIFQYFAQRDATIYERYPQMNTGIDSILEITKVTSGSYYYGEYQSNTYNTRVLLDFGTQITEISKSVASGEIGSISRKFYLNLRAIDASSMEVSYSLSAFPISESWAQGNGNFDNIPEIRDGVSWYYKDNDVNQTYWGKTGHNANTMLGHAETTQGGGAWITGSGYEANQSFDTTSPDVRMDVTDIVERWITGSVADGRVSNYGFIIKRPYEDEKSSAVFGELQFFGTNTNTIYVPRLEAAWNDISVYNPALQNEVSAEDNSIVVYFKNLQEKYKEASKTKFRIGARPKYPAKTYSTASFYQTDHYLPTSSYYAIKDAQTEETIIDFSNTYTKISSDSKGNYFNFRMQGLMPERTYRILIKTEKSGSDITQIHDNGYYFRVVR